MDYGFDFSSLYEFWPDLLNGAWLSIKMSALSLVLGFAVGAGLAIARTEGGQRLKRIVTIIVDVIRNTPLIVQTFWLFFGLAALQVKVPAFYAAIIALTINTSSYTCEIIRAGMESIHTGQKEAAACLSFTKAQILRYIVLPQAVEKMYPALMSQFVLMMLATSIMSQISAQELTAIGYQIQSQTFRGFEVYIIIAIIYLGLSWLLRLSMNLCYDLAFPRKKNIQKNSKKNIQKNRKADVEKSQVRTKDIATSQISTKNIEKNTKTIIENTQTRTRNFEKSPERIGLEIGEERTE